MNGNDQYNDFVISLKRQIVNLSWWPEHGGGGMVT